MKSLLKLLLTLVFVWGCALSAKEQAGENGSKQETQAVKQESQNESSTSPTEKKDEDEADPDCE